MRLAETPHRNVVALAAFLAAFSVSGAPGARRPVSDEGTRTPARYYAHEVVVDRYGVIAPWYREQNGQIDWRVRIAAETLKRYPWTDKPSPAPNYVFNGTWQIAADGTIAIPRLNDWDNGDLGQRAAYLLSGLVDYYRYTGDPAAIAHVTLTADALLRFHLTSSHHLWPGILISVPTRGRPYGTANPHGMIQLDIVAEVGIGLLRAYQLVGEKRWLDSANHWADLFAAHRRTDPALSPWPRYANPQDVPWEDLQTGGVVFVLEFLDEVIRLGHTGRAGSIVRARDAGRRYLRDVLLPRWTVNETWGRNYWDWPDPVQAENVTEFAARYLMEHPAVFPNWRNDVRNLLGLFLNHTSVAPESAGAVFSGAWAYPESSGCCGRSLWYGPLELAPLFAEYGVRAHDPWALEMGRRQMILATYDAHESGVVEDNIDGGQIVAGAWFKIAHPMALKHALNAIAWQPEIFGAARDNHIVRTTRVVRNVVYARGRVAFEMSDAESPAETVLRLAFKPARVTADGRGLPLSRGVVRRGFSVQPLSGGDWLVTIRHDGCRHVVVQGSDPQTEQPAAGPTYSFTGNQVRVIGSVGPDGGLAEVVLDGNVQKVGLDCWSPVRRERQVLYYRNGLADGRHTVAIGPSGTHNPVSHGTRVAIQAFQSSAATGSTGYGTGGGPTGPQRVIFGYTGRTDYVDSKGHRWRPATEWTVRAGAMADSVVAAWWTEPRRATIAGTSDPEIYRHGAHAHDLTAYFTVGPGSYSVALHFAETRQAPAPDRAVSIRINGREVAARVDLAATAGAMYHAARLVWSGIRPRSGVIEVRLTGSGKGEAILQAAEVVPGHVPGGARLVSLAEPVSDPQMNLLTNPGFEETVAGTVGRLGERVEAAGWTYVFAGTRQSYIWAETDYVIHPDLGMPVIRTGKQALRTHTDGDGHTMVLQEVETVPDTDYSAEVWVNAVDLHGKGFGHGPTDSAGIVLQELNASGAVVAEHLKADIRDAGPYRRVGLSIRTGPSTRRLRIVLDTVIACAYTEGHVTYDDCSVRRERH